MADAAGEAAGIALAAGAVMGAGVAKTKSDAMKAMNTCMPKSPNS
jgi:hypothetical protein